MNKNEPIIINKATGGYLVKPLSYIFDDEVDDSKFAVFTSITELAKWLVNHFESQMELTTINPKNNQNTKELPITIPDKTDKTDKQKGQDNQGPTEKLSVKGGGKDVGNKPSSSHKSKE